MEANLRSLYFYFSANVKAFCCADILCSVSWEQKPIEKLKFLPLQVFHFKIKTLATLKEAADVVCSC